MVNQELLNHIRQQLQQGVGQEEIKKNLIATGWQENDINEAFAMLTNNLVPSSQMPISQLTLTSLPSAIAILDQAWTLYKQRLIIFLEIMLIQIISLDVLRIGHKIFYSKFFAGGGIGPLALLEIAFYLFISFIIQTWWYMALLYAIKDSQEGIGVIESYRRGWHKILPSLWISFLQISIIMGGLLLLVVPGIIFSIWFMLSVFILIVEDLKGMDALLKSREYVRGKWFDVFWRFLFIVVLIFFLSFTLSFILGLLKGLGLLKDLINLLNLFLTPLSMIYVFLIYNHLKTIKGEFAFSPTAKQKAKFIIVGIIGLLFILVILFLILPYINTFLYEYFSFNPS